MAQPTASTDRMGLAMAHLALLALCGAFALASWRAYSLFGEVAGMAIEAPAATASAPGEYLLEPLVGAGNVRVVQSGAPANVLVLLNADAPGAGSLPADDVATLLGAAGLYRPLEGDTLTVQRTGFSAITDARPEISRADWIELVGLGGLTLLLGGVYAGLRFFPRAEAAAPVDGQGRPPAIVEASVIPARAPRDEVGTGLGRVAKARPEQVAGLLRTWIREDAA